MNSRERVRTALNHQEPDQIPLDLGAGFQTGMHVQMVYKLRQALQLDPPGTPVKIIEPYQNLGEIKMDLLEAVSGDVVGVNPPATMFGYKCENWKEWEYFDGTPVLVPEYYNTKPEPDGSILMWPEGDTSVPPSAIMPRDTYFFDSIVRQPPLDDDNLNLEDNLEEFKPISAEDLAYFGREVDRLYEGTDKAVYANFGGTAFGDIALVPAPWLKNPKGIRDIEEWYISTLTRQEYVYEIFEYQCAIALENLQKIFEVVGNKVDVVFLTGTDFGGQSGPLISVKSYERLFKPFHKQLNDWIHDNTTWKTFMHTDGSLMPLIPHFIDAGFDILNPIQWAAKNMTPVELKREFGEQLVFWGGAIDSQKTLPFGTPDEVRVEVRARIEDFRAGGGWIFNTVHNVVANVPVENLLVMYETFHEYKRYLN
ncbi:MAG: uroporphyrinogen decarboxylase family protein [Candidatus Promineifilaceae bacterium]